MRTPIIDRLEKQIVRNMELYNENLATAMRLAKEFKNRLDPKVWDCDMREQEFAELEARLK